ncbi:Poly(U)-binding-splicing factor puf60 [Linnemannia schmuckeri]|uniref:Poly(U)-binding-splicing factor puf60 n=1 Tax=Linnemannia schmuckeri TaxID=64567 RepID=A0A9P5S5U0_9FUNG|nr:Poly(U)-binding-splicing factor puf60 [Linnemannia schmuckeri]
MEDNEQTHNALKRHVDDTDNDNNDNIDNTHDSPSPSNSNNESSSKKARVDHTDDDTVDGEGDNNNTDKESITEGTTRNESAEPVPEVRDPQTGLTESQAKALERAKQYAREVQEELVKAGALTSVTEPEPSLAIANISEQRKSLCRIYVGSISFEATEDDVRQKLSRFGAIKELALKVDAATGKHRGFCFVEYEIPEAAILAVQATDTIDIGGRHLKIGRPKNYDSAGLDELPPAPEDRIYVANIGSLVSESDLAGIFSAFGAVDKCVLIPDLITRKHRGYGYVQFESGTSIDTIVDSMKGFMLLDVPMGVCKAIIGGPLPEGMKSLEGLPPVAPSTASPSQTRPAPQAAMSNSVSPAMIARATATAASTAQRLVAIGQSSGANMGNDRESVASEENMSISGNQRYLVMQSLARSGGIVPPASTAAQQPKEMDHSTVVRLQYNATPEDIDDQLEEEFKEECSKYGPVILVKLLPLADGFLRIFIQFASPIDARSAAAQLNGRQFDGKTIQATLFDQQEYIAGRLV